MSRWQRHARWALAIFAIGFAAVVALTVRGRKPPAVAVPGARTDPAAVAESVGGTTLLAKGAAQDFRVDYARARTYQDGSVKFEQVKVNIPQRAGRDFVITSNAAEVANNQSYVQMEGDVKMVASDGLEVTGSKATFDNGEGILRVPGPVTFTRGRMKGSGVGATYDRGRDVLWLLDQARIVIAPDPAGGGDADITSGAAGFARRDRYMRFERGVKLVRSGQIVEGDGAVAYLADAADTLQMMELRGNSRVTGQSGGGAGSLESMASRDMNLTFAEDGQTLQRSTLAANAVLQLAGDGGRPGRRLSSDWMDLLLSPDGKTLASISARDRVQLDIPPEGPDAPTRRITSVLLEASGPPGQGITSARFIDNVDFREVRAARPGAAAGERTARSKTLDTVTAPGFGAIDAAKFSGGVVFRDADLEATAPDATYNVTKGTLELVSPGPPGARVNDDRVTIQAAKVDITLDGRGLVAEGDVRSLLKASKDRGAGTVKRPTMLKDDQPVNVTAAHLNYAQEGGLATYTGEARLWQGETAIQAQTITIDDSKGNLTAKTNVRSTLRLLDTDQKTGKSEKKTTILTSQDLLYEEDQRRATYTTDARMLGPEGDLRADKIELYLDDTGEALDRAEAYVKVSLKSEARFSTGARLTYFAADARYLMTGAPVRVLEQLPTECRETFGRTLTFFRTTDSIQVDGNEERRTQTTSGGKCQEPRT